jgi:putative nucleotidyltransferase with HDIG domain
MTANDVYALELEVKKRAILVLVFGIFLSLIVGLLLAGRVASPIKKLLEGTRHISSGDLQHKVDVKGSDEIAELADSFNRMGANLFKAREALLTYFYRAVQSLIRVLEARDAYTSGHSDRVAEYSVRIAKEMGLSGKKIDLLRNAALLNDIGKLGVHEIILNKNTLTDEDRTQIRKHPAIGEEILRPISIDEELLAVVREHHERWDGKGYPDGLGGDKINELASIVAAADSYDAMTSNRPYQKNKTMDEAIEQLEVNRGTQFNPKVIDAFIKVLKNK